LPIELPDPPTEEAAIRRSNLTHPDHRITSLLVVLDRERQDARVEREQWSRAAEVLGLAPYGGAYNPDKVLPAVQALVVSNREMRRRLAGHLPRFPRRPFTAMPTLPFATPPLPPTLPQHDVGECLPNVYQGKPDAEPLVQEAARAQLDEILGTPESETGHLDAGGKTLLWADLIPLLFGPSLHGEGVFMAFSDDALGDSTAAAAAHAVEVMSARPPEAAQESYRTVHGYDPARLDPEGTATGKTILTAPQKSPTDPWPGPERTHVDTETGKRTPLNAIEDLQAHAAVGALGHGEPAPRRNAIYCIHGPHTTPGLFCKCQPDCPCRCDGQCPKVP
jgi:hypothetical protein